MARMMKMQLVCALLLASASWGLGSDSEEEMKALEADLLTNMFTSKAHAPDTISGGERLPAPAQATGLLEHIFLNPWLDLINKAKYPQWKMILWNICDFINDLNSQEEDTGVLEEDFVRKQFPATSDGLTLEAILALYQLQKICHTRNLQQWELFQQDMYDAENAKQDKDLMKRKTPYILKRQLHVNKARRPYILKRSSYY